MLGCKGLKQKKCSVSHNKKITQGWVFTWKSDYFYLIHWLFFRVKRVHSDRICHFQTQSSQLNFLTKSETWLHSLQLWCCWHRLYGEIYGYECMKICTVGKCSMQVQREQEVTKPKRINNFVGTVCILKNKI